MSERKCKDRIEKQLEGRKSDLHKLLKHGSDDMLGRLEDYALCFDYVAPGTFDDQKEGYLRYQISWGGPSDEFRFFINPDLSCHRIEYWFLDWFDGASLICTDDTTVLRLWDWLSETGASANAVREAGQ